VPNKNEGKNQTRIMQRWGDGGEGVGNQLQRVACAGDDDDGHHRQVHLGGMVVLAKMAGRKKRLSWKTGKLETGKIFEKWPANSKQNQ